jgi:hypothetical protein
MLKATIKLRQNSGSSSPPLSLSLNDTVPQAKKTDPRRHLPVFFLQLNCFIALGNNKIEQHELLRNMVHKTDASAFDGGYFFLGNFLGFFIYFFVLLPHQRPALSPVPSQVATH